MPLKTRLLRLAFLLPLHWALNQTGFCQSQSEAESRKLWRTFSLLVVPHQLADGSFEFVDDKGQWYHLAPFHLENGRLKSGRFPPQSGRVYQIEIRKFPADENIYYYGHKEVPMTTIRLLDRPLGVELFRGITGNEGRARVGIPFIYEGKDTGIPASNSADFPLLSSAATPSSISFEVAPERKPDQRFPRPSTIAMIQLTIDPNSDQLVFDVQQRRPEVTPFGREIRKASLNRMWSLAMFGNEAASPLTCQVLMRQMASLSPNIGKPAPARVHIQQILNNSF